MTIRRMIFAAAACAAAAVAAPLAAKAACEGFNCDSAATQSGDAKPMKLNAHMRKPVATSATRTVKKKNGEYAKIAIKRRAKHQGVTRVTAETLSPAAAQAFAAYELARVRVITPEEIGSAEPAPSNVTTVVGVDTVQVVSAEEVNDIDRQAGSTIALSLDSLSRDLAGSTPQPKAEGDTWFQRMLMVLGGAFAAAAALARSLIG